MKLDIPHELVAKIVAEDLADYKEGLEQDLERVTRTQQGFVYDNVDWQEDCRIIAAKIAAITLILEDYNG